MVFVTRETMEYDLLIVGAGPAGLSAALCAKRHARARGRDISIAVIEKAPAAGAHILSGGVLDPRALDEFWNDWRQHNPPLEGAVSDEAMYLLGKRKAFRLPPWSIPKNLLHHGQEIINLGKFVAWMAERAEAEGVDIIPGFAATTPLYANDATGSSLVGVATGDFGVARDGSHKVNFQSGIEIRARYTLLAEGCRGNLSRQIIERFQLQRQTQTYALGLRELWRIPETQHLSGLAIHALGWPLSGRAGGGGFVYFLKERLVAVGLVASLNYENPFFSPFDEFQRFKTHPKIQAILKDGERLSYGARTISEGGVQSLPKLVFAGGALVGCAAGLVNFPRMQGIHTAMKSGSLAGYAAAEAVTQNRRHDLLSDYEKNLRESWLYRELHDIRNIKPLFGAGALRNLAAAGICLWAQQLGIGKLFFWTFRHRYPDHQTLRPQAEVGAIEYPAYDNRYTFDRASSLFLSNLNYTKDQPIHLRLVDPEMPERLNLPRYGGPETRYCPAGVYEYQRSDDACSAPLILRINAANCLHCKACDIKDPTLNIVWTPPEGGNGPQYI
jgi:electron-transferring-flavoprotein dehydrogenase